MGLQTTSDAASRLSAGGSDENDDYLRVQLALTIFPRRTITIAREGCGTPARASD